MKHEILVRRLATLIFLDKSGVICTPTLYIVMHFAHTCQVI